MKKILISVVITYYKKKNYIKKTLKSLENQSFKNYQVIFIYDDPDKRDLN